MNGQKLCLIILVTFIGACALGGFIIDITHEEPTVEQDDLTNDVRYNYTLRITDSYVDNWGYNDEADEGFTFVFADITLANDKLVQGISTNFYMLNWKLVMGDGTYYNNDAETLWQSGYKNVTIEKDGKGTYTVVFEVPETTQLSDIVGMMPELSALWVYEPVSFGYDPTLA